jgi:hypothetical protein
LKRKVAKCCTAKLRKTRPAWAGFKTAEEGRAKICKFLWQKLKNKSNIHKFRSIFELFYNSFSRTILDLFIPFLEKI